MSSERDRERRIPDDGERRRDYPEVQFTLVGDEGKSPEELEEEIRIILLKRDFYMAMLELEQKTEQKPDSED